MNTKKYLLDHVLYEIEMYLYTYHYIHQCIFKHQMEFNTYWNAHNVALRNLMSFFGISGQVGKDELVYNSFSFAEQPSNRKNRQKYYSPISKAINHIAIQRFEGYNGRALDDIVKEAQDRLFPEIQQYIHLFISHLENEENITYSINNPNRTVDISEELKDERIKRIIGTAKRLIIDCSTISSNSEIGTTGGK